MRVIAGKYKGKLLSEFDLKSTRPTADMVREALFDKIGVLACDCTFLDLFSGTGAVGIEALSRGAKFCTFVDHDKTAVKITKKNIESVNANNQEILNMDFLTALEYLKKQKKQFDIIFLDPPYKTDFAEISIDWILKNKLLSTDGLIVWEHDEEKLKYAEQNFSNSKTKKYGKKYLTYIQNNE